MSIRNVSRAPILFQTEANEAIEAIEANEASPEQKLDNEESSNLTKGGSYINKDRTVVIDVDTSIKYIQSEGENFATFYRLDFKDLEKLEIKQILECLHATKG